MRSELKRQLRKPKWRMAVMRMALLVADCLLAMPALAQMGLDLALLEEKAYNLS